MTLNKVRNLNNNPLHKAMITHKYLKEQEMKILEVNKIKTRAKFLAHIKKNR